MKTKRIGHVTFHYFPIVGGQEVYIQNMINVLEIQGFKNVVYQPISKHVHFFNNNSNGKIKPILFIPYFNKYIKDFKKITFSCFLLTRFFSFLKDDIIIVHYAFHSWPLLLFRKKVIVLSHGVEWDLRYLSMSDKLHAYIATKTFNTFVLVANDSHYLRTMSLNAKSGINFFKEVANKKWFIPNCISTTKFRPIGEKFEYTKNRKFILVPRQITEDRGIDLAIQAFSLVATNYNYIDLLILGAIKDKSYKKKCDELINQLEIINRVFWKHNVDNNDIAKFYRSAYITLIPTLRREGTSLSALEAMACMCPVVSTNVAGLADLPALKTEPTKENLSIAIEHCINNRQQIIQEQFEFTINIFNETNWANAWLSVINSTLSLT